MDCRASSCFVRCGCVYVTVGNGSAHSCMLPRICVAAHLCFPCICGAAHSYTATHSPWRRAFVCAAHPCAAHTPVCCRALVVLPRTCMLQRTFVCIRAVLCIAAQSLGVTHG